MKRKKNYVNNRDLLKEIHKSKNSFSSYIAKEYEDYDIIIDSIEKMLDPQIMQDAKIARAERLARKEYDARIKAGEVIKLSQINIDVNTIKDSDVVFRVTMYDHIPGDKNRKKNPKTVKDVHTRLNFPPFQHYILNEDNEPVCVGKSHWVGGMENGHFSQDHGKINNTLALMFIELAKRYSSKWNWRGYSYRDEMQQTALLQLSQVGLQFDESKSQNPFAYYTATVKNSFRRVLNTEKKNQEIRDDILEMNNLTPSNTRQNESLFNDF